MTIKPMQPSDIEVLERLLSIYGADRDRWPAAERLQMAPLLAGDAQARRMLREAQALDRLLDLAPAVASSRQPELMDRIASIAATQRRQALSETVSEDATMREPIRFEVASRIARAPAAMLQKRRPMLPPGASLSGRGRAMPAAALLAASLLVGVFAGWSQVIGGMLGDSTVEVSSASEPTSSTDLQHLVFGDDTADAGEEDFL